MSQTFRLTEILEIARAEGRVMVDDLARRFDVTVQTIRRDLSALADSGRLDRVHGGAVMPSSIVNIGYQDRRGLHEAGKAAIGRRCARDLPENASVFLSIGTSTEAVARELLHHRNLLVVTNNINIAHILAPNTDCNVIVTGGALRRSDGGLVGSLAIATIEQFKFDYAVVGCSALDEDGDLLDFDIQEVEVNQTIIRQSRRTWLVADHSKFSRRAPARIASLRDLDVFYTDRPLSADLSRKCADWGTGIILAPE
jgi:DeoR family glycerol-3-phosphate regulon repressor